MGIGISAVVISRNRCERLVKALEDLNPLKTEGIIAELLLVDDGSTDGTSQMIKEHYPHVMLVRLPSPQGIPRARNEGALHASQELILFLDDDGVLEYGAALAEVGRLLQAEERLAGVAFPVVLGLENIRPRGHRAPRLRPTHTFYGGAALLKKRAFIEVGMYPGHFFYSHEEDDLALRLLARGYGLACCEEIRFLHDRADAGKIAARMKKIYYYYRNRQWVIWRHLPWRPAMRESVITLLGGAARTIFTLHFFAFLAGSLAAFSMLPRLAQERTPLSEEQYQHYCRLVGRERLSLSRRLRDLVDDIRRRRRLHWI